MLAFQVPLNRIPIYLSNDFHFCFLCSALSKWIISCPSDTTHFFSTYLSLHILFSLGELPATASTFVPSSGADAPSTPCAASAQASLAGRHLLKLDPLEVHLNCPVLKKLFLPAHPKLTQSLSPIHPESICFNYCMSLFMGFGT